jgi:HEAT repeat protein
MNQTRNEVSDQELKKVIADFLDQGHVDNIIAMFRRDPAYYAWTADLLQDERLSVRIGISVLFEELHIIQPKKLALAIPSLSQLLGSDNPQLRGEALSILGIIDTPETTLLIKQMQNDPNPQVQEIVQLVLEELVPYS